MAPPAAPTLAAEVEDAFANVRVVVGLPSGAVTLWLWRVGPSGTPAHVRGAEALAVTGAEAVVRDYEAPLGVPLEYHARVANEAGETSPEAATVTVEVWAGIECDAWLMDLAQPGNSQVVELESLQEMGYEAPTGIHYVLGRRDPITTGEIAHTPSFELGFVTESPDERIRARDTLGDGAPVLLRTPPAIAGNLYFVAPKWSEQRINKRPEQQIRRFVCEAVQIDRPDALLFLPVAPTETYAEVQATFATYAALMAARSDYDDVLHEPIGEAPPSEPVVPWPAVDV